MSQQSDEDQEDEVGRNGTHQKSQEKLHKPYRIELGLGPAGKGYDVVRPHIRELYFIIRVDDRS
jgi:hypothetical protein